MPQLSRDIVEIRAGREHVTADHMIIASAMRYLGDVLIHQLPTD